MIINSLNLSRSIKYMYNNNFKYILLLNIKKCKAEHN
jgi:hypothetical protein